jgi:hypothetical protein
MLMSYATDVTRQMKSRDRTKSKGIHKNELLAGWADTENMGFVSSKVSAETGRDGKKAGAMELWN